MVLRIFLLFLRVKNFLIEIHDYFKEEKGSLCCRVLTRRFKKFGSKEHKEQCALFTGELAYKTAEVIARELNIIVVKDGIEEVKIKRRGLLIFNNPDLHC